MFINILYIVAVIVNLAAVIACGYSFFRAKKDKNIDWQIIFGILVLLNLYCVIGNLTKLIP